MELHAEILRKNGKGEYAILPYREFLALRQLLEDAEDLLELRRAKAKEAKAPSLSLEQVRLELGLQKP